MRCIVVAVACAACATTNGPKPMEHRFIATGDQFRAQPRATAARLLVSDEEVSAEPPFKLVGVVEVEGKETEHLQAFVARAQEAGAASGCDVLVERDAFELGTRIVRPFGQRGFTRGSVGRDWQRSDQVVWQFLCGVSGATDDEEAQTMREATALAIHLRWKELGGYEPCEQYTPTGSHVRKTRVCANDPGHHSEADGRSSAPSH